jgi:hypothetical protein
LARPATGKSVPDRLRDPINGENSSPHSNPGNERWSEIS